MEYPCVLVTAIQQDAMVPIIDSETPDPTGVFATGTRHISVDEATVVLDSLQEKHCELGDAQQSMLYLLKSLYQNQQQSPKSRLRKKHMMQTPKIQMFSSGSGWITFGLMNLLSYHDTVA